MDRSLPALVVGALVLVSGCTPEEPGAEPFLVISGPAAFAGIELREAGAGVIWRLAADPPAPLPELHYGRVPPGFRQELPAGGEPPRSLLPGEALVLVSTTPRRVFRHAGLAGGEGRFSIESWVMELRPPAAAASVDGSPAPP